MRFFKFVSPVAPPVDNAEAHLEPARLQQQVFMEEVNQQQMLPTIRYVFIKICRNQNIS